MAETIFQQRRRQLAATTQSASFDEARARRVGARRQVLEAFQLVDAPSSTSPSAPSDLNVNGSSGGDVSNGSRGTTGSQRGNPEANAFNTAIQSLFEFDTNAAIDTTLGLFGVVNPVFGFATQIALGAGLQASSPVGTVFSNPLSNFLGLSNVNTPTGLRTVDISSNRAAAFTQRDVNPELNFAQAQQGRDVSQRAPGETIGDSRGDTSGLGQSAPGTPTEDTRDQSGLSQGAPGSRGGDNDSDTGGQGGVGQGGGIGL